MKKSIILAISTLAGLALSACSTPNPAGPYIKEPVCLCCGSNHPVLPRPPAPQPIPQPEAATQGRHSVYFDFDSAVIKPQYQADLGKIASILAARRDFKIVVSGNADERGSAEYNLALGQTRAEAVRKALAAQGV